MTVRAAGRLLGRVLLGAAAVWLATLSLLAIHVATAPRTPPLPGQADAIICLGAGLSEDIGWTVPDAASYRRALTCAGLQAAGVAPVVVFTGYGHGVNSAAAAMARSAIEAGLPAGAVLLEERARSTLQNAAYSLALLPEDARRIVIVSDRFHLPRSLATFRALGATDPDVYPADPAPDTGGFEGRSPLIWQMREAAAIWYNAGRGAIYWLGGLVGIPPETRIAWFN